MTLFLALTAIFKSFAISLGVGSSTLAITNFFVAISDGTIDATERRMMGVVYIVLRIAMVAILVTTIITLGSSYDGTWLRSFEVYELGQMLVIFVLFANATLMTAHIVPSNFGPAIQAGNWYTLGTLSALQGLGLTHFTFSQFLFSYITWVLLAIAIVNGIMALLRAKRHGLLKK